MEAHTYQDMASELMKMYDPQGLMEPVRAVFKSLYSRFIKEKKQWRDKISEEALAEWNNTAEK